MAKSVIGGRVSIEDAVLAIRSSKSQREAADRLGICQVTVSRFIVENDIDTSHFPKQTGLNNSNYRHGKHCVVQLCECGREKDYRAKKCAICAHRGYSKNRDKILSRNNTVSMEDKLPVGNKPLRESIVTNDMIKIAIRDNDNYRDAAKSIGMSRFFITRAKERLGLDISHFMAGRGRPYTDANIFRSGHKQRIRIRDRFLALDSSKYFCWICNQAPKWNGKTLRLEADHINRDRTDNRIENLRWICPNCHTQRRTALIPSKCWRGDCIKT